jgi:hypothetical protein
MKAPPAVQDLRRLDPRLAQIAHLTRLLRGLSGRRRLPNEPSSKRAKSRSADSAAAGGLERTAVERPAHARRWCGLARCTDRLRGVRRRAIAAIVGTACTKPDATSDFGCLQMTDSSSGSCASATVASCIRHDNHTGPASTRLRSPVCYWHTARKRRGRQSGGGAPSRLANSARSSIASTPDGTAPPTRLRQIPRNPAAVAATASTSSRSPT